MFPQNLPNIENETIFFHTNCSINQMNWTTKNFFLGMPVTTVSETSVLSEKLSWLPKSDFFLWFEDRVWPDQLEILWNTTNWSRVIFLLAEGVGVKNVQQFFKDFLRLYINKDVLTSEAMQKVVEIYHNKVMEMPELECTFHRANICLHSSSSSKFSLFTESDTDMLSKVVEDMVGGVSTVFKRKAAFDETRLWE